MATDITQKDEPLFISDSMATYDHMEEENPGMAFMNNVPAEGQTRILWTVVLEETLIAVLTLTLLWVSLG